MFSLDGWLFWAILSALFAALTAIFAKLGLRDIDPDFAQLIRTGVVLVALAVIVPLAGKWQALGTISGRVWAYLVLSGMATGASWICYFRALNIGDASKVAAVDKLSVLLVALFAAFALHERLSPLGWVGVAAVTAGLVMIGAAR